MSEQLDFSVKYNLPSSKSFISLTIAAFNWQRNKRAIGGREKLKQTIKSSLVIKKMMMDSSI